MTANPSEATPAPSLFATVGRFAEWMCLGLVSPFRWVVRGWLPYGYHILGSLARAVAYLLVSLPVLVVAFCLPAYLMGGETLILRTASESLALSQSWWAGSHENPFILAGLLVLGYVVLGILPYQPNDKHLKEWRTREEPDGPYEWEYLVFTLIASLPPLGLFGLWWLRPTSATVLPYGWLAIGGLLIGCAVALYNVARRWACRVRNETTRERLDRETLTVNGFLYLLVGCSMVGVVLFVGVERAAFPAAVGTLGWIVRKLRWMLYEDRDGFLDVRPNLILWGTLARGPYAYALCVWLLTSQTAVLAVEWVIGCLFAPLAVLALYLGYRYYRAGGRMYLRYPRSKYQPDEWDVEEYVRQTYLSAEQAQALHPRNRLSVGMRRVRRKVMGVNRAVAQLDGDFPTFSPLELARMVEEPGSTYDTRRQALARVNGYLSRVRRAVEDSSVEGADEALSSIEAAEDAVAKARDWNEDVGERLGENLIGKLAP